MSNRDSRNSRKIALKRWKDSQRAAARAKLPLPNDQLQALFDMLDRELPRAGCDRTRRLTESFLRQRDHDVAAVFAWLDDNGGFCDCEVLANTEQYWLEALREPLLPTADDNKPKID